MVISKTYATELFHLSESESTQYVNDMLQVAKALDAVFYPRKLNDELLGNTVAHLHCHLVPRYDWDPHPKRPIWEHSHTPIIFSPEAYDARIVAIGQHLS
ncbi:MAG TPA: HIT domain-containing protein [Alphaproteobacteria bacterium]|nr:HIT domain-containing protein [Alphaproteobacteria bacterium]